MKRLWNWAGLALIFFSLGALDLGLPLWTFWVTYVIGFACSIQGARLLRRERRTATPYARWDLNMLTNGYILDWYRVAYGHLADNHGDIYGPAEVWREREVERVRALVEGPDGEQSE